MLLGLLLYSSGSHGRSPQEKIKNAVVAAAASSSSSSSTLQAGKPRRRVSHLSLTKTRAGKRKRRKAVEMRGRAGGQSSTRLTPPLGRRLGGATHACARPASLDLPSSPPAMAAPPHPSRRGAKQTLVHKNEKGNQKKRKREGKNERRGPLAHRAVGEN